jgi:hypothetical protein
MLKYLYILCFVFLATTSCQKNADVVENIVIEAPAINNIKQKQPVTLVGSNNVNESVVWEVTPKTGFSIDTNKNKATFIFNASGVYTILAKTASLTTKFSITINDSIYGAIDQYFYYTSNGNKVSIEYPKDSFAATIQNKFDSSASQYYKEVSIFAMSRPFNQQSPTNGEATLVFKDTSNIQNQGFISSSFYSFFKGSYLTYQNQTSYNITKFEGIGGYIEGSFTAKMKINVSDSIATDITGNFRVKRLN